MQSVTEKIQKREKGKRGKFRSLGCERIVVVCWNWFNELEIERVALSEGVSVPQVDLEFQQPHSHPFPPLFIVKDIGLVGLEPRWAFARGSSLRLGSDTTHLHFFFVETVVGLKA